MLKSFFIFNKFSLYFFIDISIGSNIVVKNAEITIGLRLNCKFLVWFSVVSCKLDHCGFGFWMATKTRSEIRLSEFSLD